MKQEYQREDTPNQPSEFRRKNWFKINDESRGTYNTNSQIKFKTSKLKSNLYDYSDMNSSCSRK